MRQSRGLPVRLIGIEAEPTHFKWARQHLRDNRLAGGLHRAADGDAVGQTNFFTGSAGKWYGQGIANDAYPPTAWRKRMKRMLLRQPSAVMDTVERVPTVSLQAILSNVTDVDLIHSDIQGSEDFAFPSAMEQMDAKVRRVIIGTHSPAIEQHLRAVFSEHSWSIVHDYGTATQSDTPYGKVAFVDGVQVWSNDRLH